MPDSDPTLIGRVAMPHFNWMGALFGGPQYMSQYFAGRDAAQQLQEQRGLDQTSARALVASPEFLKAMNPRDLPAANMWATAQGGNPTMSALGTSLFESGVQQGYGQDMAKFNQAITQQNAKFNQQIDQQNAKFGQQIAQENTDYSANSSFNLFKKENEYNQGVTAQNWKAIMDPANAGNTVMLKSLLKANGVDVPFGYDPVMQPNGGMMFTPSPGGEQWQTMMKEVQPVQAVQKGVDDMLTMAQQGTATPSNWYTTKTWLGLKMKDLAATGALDKDSVEQFDKLFPDRFEDWQNMANPAGRKTALETLRVTKQLIDGELRQRQQKWFLQPGQLPNEAGGALPIPGKDIPPPPEGGGPTAPQPGTSLTHPTATIRAPTTASQRAAQGADSIWRKPEVTKRMWQGAGR